ncbi:MAG TPA: type II toxin-antitoxin system YafQ family toxin [Xanthobacteraceae bacterium]|jgi:mRNA interferase YafQ|nr:type II toxin-antitoxin system YafQ family toxin [Xanthobacteraceae bacterium]
MRRIAQRKQFRDDIKRQKRRDKDIEDLIAVVELLAEQGSLPAAYRPHKLTGEWRGVWECHIEPDWLLIYAVAEDEVLLIRTGTHADLFG